MKETGIIYIPTSDLNRDFGKGFKQHLDTLVKEGLLESYEEVIRIKVEVHKFHYTQAALEIEEASLLPSNPKPPKQGDY